MTTIREIKRADYRCHKLLLGEEDGFRKYVVFATKDRYIHYRAPAGFEYIDRDADLGVTFAVEKDNIWAVWKPGWGFDCHYPEGSEPDYLKRSDGCPCEYTGGKCKSDGSSLADGEHFWPAFREGVDSVFAKLIEWWRPANA